jgi:uncharacterized BrkB/YihY/UPF0761 family membrane protein
MFIAIWHKQPPYHIYRRMRRGALFIIVPLVVFLIAAAYASIKMWNSMGDNGAMDGNGIAALIIGGAGTLLVGGGLMALLFYSSRRGYDDAADLKSRPPEER